MVSLPDLKNYRASAEKAKEEVDQIIHQLRCALNTWEMIRALIDEELEEGVDQFHLKLLTPKKNPDV